MRVLHFYKTYFPDSMGGTEQVINQLARGTRPLGVHNTVLTLSPNPSGSIIDIDGHQVQQVQTSFEVASTPISFKAFSLFRRKVKEVDLIHYHFPYPFADILHLIAGLKIPSVLTYHSDIVKQKRLLTVYRPLKKRFLSVVDQIIATSPNYLKSSEVLRQYKHKVSVVPIGLDKASYPSASTERLAYWRKKMGGRFFLFIGVLRYYKGLHVLIEAAKQAEYPIVVMGSGPIEHELKVQAIRQGVSNIVFIGYQSAEDKVALLTLCLALVFPSNLRSEAFGISLLEGAMYGKPLICCEIGTGTSFINQHGKTGFVIPPNDPTALRTAMDFLWKNPTLAEAMGQAAEKRYLQHFTAKQMAESYLEVYQKVLAKKAKE